MSGVNEEVHNQLMSKIPEGSVRISKQRGVLNLCDDCFLAYKIVYKFGNKWLCEKCKGLK